MRGKKTSAAGGSRIVAVSMGDAAGVGPELCARLLAEKRWAEGTRPLIVGSARILARAAKALRLPLRAEIVGEVPRILSRPAILDFPDFFRGREVTPGRTDARCGAAAAHFIEAGARACLAGRCAALLTAPISKHSLRLAGVKFPGHTEMLAELTGSRRFAMLLYSEPLAVAFATLHRALRSVPGALTAKRLVEVAILLDRSLRALRGGRPRLAVLGLNPHAGEGGLFGREEETIIAPAVRRMRALGLAAEGPLPPDTAFIPASLARYQGHLAMYHDQGCAPFKMIAFEAGVNITLGLGIVRTSPDHGTAFDLAWKGVASPGSFFAAYRLAAQLGTAGGLGLRRRAPE